MTTDRPRKRGITAQTLNTISRSLSGDYSFVFTGEVRGLVDDDGNKIEFKKRKKCVAVTGKSTK